MTYLGQQDENYKTENRYKHFEVWSPLNRDNLIKMKHKISNYNYTSDSLIIRQVTLCLKQLGDRRNNEAE